jgi:hypothetical protein
MPVQPLLVLLKRFRWPIGSISPKTCRKPFRICWHAFSLSYGLLLQKQRPQMGRQRAHYRLRNGVLLPENRSNRPSRRIEQNERHGINTSRACRSKA